MTTWLTIPDPTEKALNLDTRRGYFAWRTPTLDGPDGDAWVELAVYHFANSGTYSATVNVTRRSEGVSAYFPLEATRVAAERGRYSRKRFQAFAEAALRALPEKAPAVLLAAITGQEAAA